MTVVTNWVCGRLRKNIEFDENFQPHVVEVAPIYLHSTRPCQLTLVGNSAQIFRNALIASPSSIEALA